MAGTVQRQLGLSETTRQLLANISVQPVGQANILTIVASASSADKAASVANAFAAQFVKQRSRLFQAALTHRLDKLSQSLQPISGIPGDTAEVEAIQAQIALLNPYRGEPDPTVQIVRPATPPYGPSSPHAALSLLVALIGSLLLGFGAAIGLDAFDKTIKNEAELHSLGWLPVLARLPRTRSADFKNALEGEQEPASGIWDACRTLSTNLSLSQPKGAFPSKLLITSAARDGGQSAVTASLALSLAAGGAQVVAVDGDLRSPKLADTFGIVAPSRSVRAFFTSRTEAGDAVTTFHGENLQLLLSVPTSSERRDLREVLDARSVQRGLQRLLLNADVVIVDSSAIHESTDALTMASAVEAVLVVVQLGHTRLEDLQSARRVLAQQPIKTAGFVVLPRVRGVSRWADWTRSVRAARRASVGTTQATAQPRP
jgi:non-specific protein-tyrosine kinase